MSKMSLRRLSLRRVLFVLSGILVHYVGYYSFYQVYSFIMSDIITSDIITSDIITSGIITSGIITSGITTSDIITSDIITSGIFVHYVG